MKQLIEDGKFTPCATNSWANSKIPFKNLGFSNYYRSSWDAAFQILNPKCIYEKVRIPYLNLNNEKHIYIVDFVDEENKILYEIKPKILIETKNNILKTNAALNWCKKNNYTFKIISNEFFEKNAKNINYSIYDKKLFNGMKQFL